MTRSPLVCTAPTGVSGAAPGRVTPPASLRATGVGRAAAPVGH
jgi:hypothetical protein